ncbi:MAG: ABZJ_00895 family protein [Arenibacterium sp.]
MANADQPKLGRLALIYFGFLILTSVLLVVGVGVVESYFKVEVPTTGAAMATIVFPAMLTGQNFARKSTRRPEAGEAWRFAGVVFAINFLLGAAILFSFLTLAGETATFLAMLQGDQSRIFLGMTLFVVVVQFWGTRFCFVMGANMTIKQIERARSSG